MKKSIYCVGQEVIFESFNKGRMKAIVKAIVKGIDTDSGLYLSLSDGTYQFTKPNDDRVSCVEEFLDLTSAYYHHSRFAEFQDRANIAFRGHMFALNELEELAEDLPEKIYNFLVSKITSYKEKYSEDYAAAVELRDLASMNMAQWWDWEKNEGYTLNNHFPFINPEGIEGYQL